MFNGSIKDLLRRRGGSCIIEVHVMMCTNHGSTRGNQHMTVVDGPHALGASVVMMHSAKSSILDIIYKCREYIDFEPKKKNAVMYVLA